MEDMQRYREIRDNADPEDPTVKLRGYLTIAFDQALAEAIRLERQGKPGKVRALGFIETADLLERTAPPAPAPKDETKCECGCPRWWHNKAGDRCLGDFVCCPCRAFTPAAPTTTVPR